MEVEHVYRVTLRGRFAQLEDSALAYLKREQPQHDIFVSAYTAEGTFTYDERVQFFNLRYEVRTAKGADAAGDIALHEGELFLRTLGYSHLPLKVNVVDTSTMWGN